MRTLTLKDLETMRITPTTRTLLFSLALLLGAAGCKQETRVSQTEEGTLVLGAAEQTATTERSVSLGTRTLVLDGFRGAVRLDGSSGTDLATLSFTRRARGTTQADARKVLEATTIEESGDETAYTYKMRTSDARLSAVDVQGQVPRGTIVQIKLESGTVELSGIDGPLNVKLEGGTIDVAGAGESVDVETRNGNLSVAMAQVPFEGSVRMRTENGDLTLTLPATASAMVKARTSSGDITTAGLDFRNPRLTPDAAGSDFRGQLGQGGATIDLRTENGTITLNEGTVTMLAPRDSVRTDLAPPDTVLDTAPGATPPPMPPDTMSAPMDSTPVRADTSAI